jgi:small subunit ribosomal protein S9
VNGRPIDHYFPRLLHQKRAQEGLEVTESQGLFDVQVRVNGGGISGQADAVRMALARALVAHDEEHRAALRSKGLLTRDARKVERKKPGRPKARKRFQFSKR